MSTTELTPAQIAGGISAAYAQFIEREMRRGSANPHPYAYASSWTACTRQMALDMMAAEKGRVFDANTLANFRRGRDRERDLKSDLVRVGRDCTPSFEVVGEEETFELRDHKGRVAIRGKVDLQLKFADLKQRAPLEIKAWHPNLVAKVKTFDDLFANRWTRKGSHQLLSYMYAMEVPVGFMLLDRNGLPMLLEVELDKHLDKIEDFLAKAEAALDAVIADTLPPFIDDPTECKVCDYFGVSCQPPLSYEGASIVTDEETITALERREELKEAAAEYDRLDTQVKERFRGLPQAIAGKFLIQGKAHKKTLLVFPDEATKKQFQQSDPTGSWRIEITKVDG